jgi:hypothetical protein
MPCHQTTDAARPVNLTLAERQVLPPNGMTCARKRGAFVDRLRAYRLHVHKTAFNVDLIGVVLELTVHTL